MKSALGVITLLIVALAVTKAEEAEEADNRRWCVGYAGIWYCSRSDGQFYPVTEPQIEARDLDEDVPDLEEGAEMASQLVSELKIDPVARRKWCAGWGGIWYCSKNGGEDFPDIDEEDLNEAESEDLVDIDEDDFYEAEAVADKVERGLDLDDEEEMIAREIEERGWGSWGRGCKEDCENGGTKYRGRCKCMKGFSGRCCEKDKDQGSWFRRCKECENGGTKYWGRCKCVKGFSGRCCDKATAEEKEG